MRVQSAEFVKSCVTPNQYPTGCIPEVAFVGRSNVGKSSVINSLLNRKGLTKVGKIPGKTQTINFYHVATSNPRLPYFHLVDLPGYGYAKVPHAVTKQWGPMVEEYIQSRETLSGVVGIIDARGDQPQDTILIKWLGMLSCEIVLVANKGDKLAKGKRQTQIEHIRQRLALPEETILHLYSARTHEGRAELLTALEMLILAKT